MKLEETATAENETAPFAQQATSVLRRLRGSFGEIIAALPASISSAADLQRTLKIDTKLCWKIFRVANAADALAEGLQVPGSANMRTFLKAVGRRGVPPDSIEAASRAAAEFERLVALHAGDRANFDSMISALAGSENANRVNLVHKRAAFRANRHLWGTQAKTQLKCMLVSPGEDPRTLDGAAIEGYLDLRRLRQDIPLLLSHSCSTDDEGAVRQVLREPLDPRGETTHRITLLPQFCSKPLPGLRTVESNAGIVHSELLADGVGNTAAVTFISGRVDRQAAPRYRAEHNRFGHHHTRVCIPCEVLILDLVVHEETFGPITPNALVYGEHRSDRPLAAPPREEDLLQAHESVVYLGKGPSVLHTLDLPRYAEMVRYAFARLGWDGERFDVYRCRVAFPVMPSTVAMRFELPDAPAS